MYHFYLIASQLFYVLTLHVSSIYIHVPLLPHCLTIILCSNITCIKCIYTCTTSISLPHMFFVLT